LSTTVSLVACVALALFLIASPVELQEAPAAPAVPTLASLDLPLAQLKDGRQEFEYRMSMPGSSSPPESLGSFVLTTKVEGGKFNFTDRADLQIRGQPYWIEMTALGPVGKELRPEHLTVRGTTDDLDGKTFEFSADFTATSATMTAEGKKRQVAVPAGTISDAALYRLVTLLPRRAGFVASYEHFLDASELNMKPGGTITCASATENVDLGGKPVKTFRFDVTSGDSMFLSLWVDDAGRLVQACLDGRKWLVAKS
jgi:hypothetical protein